MRTVACPFCRNNPSEVRETRDGLIVIACRDCSYRYRKEFSSYSRYDEPYGYNSKVKYSPGDYIDDYKPEPIKVNAEEMAKARKDIEIAAMKVAAEKAANERQKLLNILKDTGLDQPLD